ncbi:uncharacterized protein TRIADDRAFT_24784 [Trichoplax adhaerens]|uniref:Cullin-5 n=1 Tax=Trichoplax adhaerens TaxID=10228 RepID=B3RYE9_TRIAD|nr:hypothetical protein TRIADDRAFT_24784 [Trichoplax adhaerens]EDV25026.1 hypothetical protein TRIADDRAFT_24784 [Trichoplax adhaerens]|eukprot:XP_002112916.1 hypothetical protein TRIADDRAFT_24784 [Trichoplax adhaerens]
MPTGLLLSADDSSNDDFERSWQQIEHTLLALLNQQPISKREWQDLFALTFRLSMWYESSNQIIVDNFNSVINRFVLDKKEVLAAQSDKLVFLQEYVQIWETYYRLCDYIPQLFKRLEVASTNKSGSAALSVSKRNKCQAFRDTMLEKWKDGLLNYHIQRLLDNVMELIIEEKRNHIYNGQLITNIKDALVHLHCSKDKDKLDTYQQFERAYMKNILEYYKLQSSMALDEMSMSDYIRYVDAKLREEEDNCRRYLEFSSMKVVLESIENHLINSRKSILLQECFKMIKNGNTADLIIIFKLLDRVNGCIDNVLEALSSHILESGMSTLLTDAEVIIWDSEKYVDKFIGLYEKFSELLKGGFNDDARFLSCRDQAFKKIINDRTIFSINIPTKIKGMGKLEPESRCPELLAGYCDLLLRKTNVNKKLTSGEIERRLKDALLLLKYVQNKDVFMRYYKVHLMKRLLLDITADQEMEENMIEWLRNIEMPVEFINKLAKMFHDIHISHDVNNLFKEARSKEASDTINAKILSAAAWSRGSENTNVSLPSELAEYIKEIEGFYHQKYTTRKLQWHHLYSSGTITFATNYGKYDLEVTTFQMSVLFAWNLRPSDEISLDSLRIATGLNESELRKTLFSLTNNSKMKYQILLVNPSVQSFREYTHQSIFRINRDFNIVKSGKIQKRGKVTLIGRLQLAPEKGNEEENKEIASLRMLRTQEAIIKIMKMRKRLRFGQLQTELVNVLKNMFFPQKAVVKDQLEKLIEENYIKRDEQDLNTFIYLA